MDDVGFGRLLRAVRIRRGWRQADVADRAGVSRAQTWRAESGRLEELRFGEIRAIAAALEVRVRLDATWRGGDADRLVNEAHSRLVERAVTILTDSGWTCAVEATFSIWGERGAMDILAWHGSAETLLVVEVKTELADPAALVAQVDRYRRLAAAAARDRGWVAEQASVWVVVGESSMNRARYSRTKLLLRTPFPLRGHAIRGWLARPTGVIAGMSFLPDAQPGSGKRKMGPVRRVRRRREPAQSSGQARDAHDASVPGT